MNKLKNMISMKDLVFGLIILAMVVVLSFRPSNKVRFAFNVDSVDIKTTKYQMNIPYDMVDHIELITKPDLGEEVDGYDDNVIHTGTWHNEAWGKYESCIEVATDNCIVIHLTDGRIFVVSRRDNEETTLVYKEFLTHLQ